MSALTNSLDALVSRVSDALSSPSNRSPLITAGALASILSVYAISRSRFDDPTLPEISPAPEPQKDGPYPYDFYEGGKTLNTPYGRMRYYEFGPEKGEKVLLVHGISVPSPTWGKITPQLTKAGYRVCLVDLFGRGYSDSPQVPYDSSLYVSQLALLLAALPDWTKFHLIGQSMGGGIVASFAYYFPDRIDKLVLVCPAGATPRPELPLLNRFFVSSWLSVGGMRALLPFAPVPLPNSPETIPGWQLRHHKGFLHSFLSSLRSGPIYDQAAFFNVVIKKFGNRVEAIWGDADTTVPMESSKFIDPSLTVRVVPGGRHFISTERPEETGKYILDFLGRK